MAKLPYTNSMPKKIENAETADDGRPVNKQKTVSKPVKVKAHERGYTQKPMPKPKRPRGTNGVSI